MLRQDCSIEMVESFPSQTQCFASFSGSPEVSGDIAYGEDGTSASSRDLIHSSQKKGALWLRNYQWFAVRDSLNKAIIEELICDSSNRPL